MLGSSHLWMMLLGCCTSAYVNKIPLVGNSICATPSSTMVADHWDQNSGHWPTSTCLNTDFLECRKRALLSLCLIHSTELFYLSPRRNFYCVRTTATQLYGGLIPQSPISVDHHG
jgi:hypothetical protein